MVGAELVDEHGTLALGELIDLSANGARVTLMARYDDGSRLRIALDPAIAGTALRFEAEIKWCEVSPAGFSYGLVLRDTPPEVRSQIEALVHARDDVPDKDE
jgi:hypothetical protein